MQNKNNIFWNDREKMIDYYGVVESKRSKVKSFLYALGGTLLRKHIITADFAEYLFFSPSVQRKDYQELMNSLYEQKINKKGRIIICTEKKFYAKAIWNIFKNIKHIFDARYIYIPEEFSEIGRKKLNVIMAMTIYLREIEWIDVFDQINKMDLSKVKCVTVLCDAWSPENIFVQVANSRGIVTVDYLHGIPPLPDIDKSPYLLYYKIPSDVQLVWGRISADYYKSHSPKAYTYVVGNSTIKDINEIEDKLCVGIVLDHRYYQKENNEMIKIMQSFAKKKGYKLKIRIHPSCMAEDYAVNKIISKFDSNLNDCNFIVCHTSSMLITYSAQKKKVLRFKTEVPYNDIDDEICFSTLEELEELENNFGGIDFKKIGEKNLQYIGEASKEQVKCFYEQNSIIDSIYEKKREQRNEYNKKI